MLAESDDISSGLRGVKSTRALISARETDVRLGYTLPCNHIATASWMFIDRRVFVDRVDCNMKIIIVGVKR